MNSLTTLNNVSVIMVSYQTGPALWLAIDSVLEQPECRELLLIDNGNIPSVMGRLSAKVQTEPRLKLVSGQGNVGFAKACNMGARAATGEILLLLNPDCMLPEGGLGRAVDVLRRFPDNTLAGCYLINPDGSEQRGSRRALLTPKNAFAESFHLGRFFKADGELNLHGTPMPEAAHEVPAISGAFMMLSRAFYTVLGGLDEGYFLHMEDMDLCASVHEAGGKVICMPEIQVIHFRSTSEIASAVVERHKSRGFVRYLNKHYAKAYSSFLLSCMSLCIWLRYCLKAFVSSVDRIFVPPLVAKREIARLVLLYRLARYGPRDNSLLGKTVLVIGASGQTGLCVVGQALARGARVIGVYRNTSIPFTHPNLQWVQRNLKEQPLDIQADVLIHTGGLWLLADLIEDIFKSGLRRVIAFGSTSMFAKVDTKSSYEQEIVVNLKSAEERISKLAFEYKADVTILRPTMIYGVGLDANLTRMADVVRRFGILPIYGNASGLRHPVQAQDLAKAALDIINYPATFSKSYNLGGAQIMTYYEMVVLLFEHLGKKPRIFRPPFLPFVLDWLGKIYQLGHISGEIAYRMKQDLVFDCRDAINDFGYHAKKFLQGDVEI